MFGRTPTQIRKRSGSSKTRDNTTLLLRYSPPFDFEQLLDFMHPRAVKNVELVTRDSYSRTFRTVVTRGYFTVRDNPSESALELSIVCDNIKCFMEVHNRVRRMFDLDTDFTAINDRFVNDELLSRGMEKGHVPRMPVAFNPFEAMVRAIVGQQITVKAATTIAGRIANTASIKTAGGFPDGLAYFFQMPRSS